jgi:hypothetical protein
MVEPCAEDIKMRGKREQEIEKTSFETLHSQTYTEMAIMLVGGGGGGTNYDNRTLM